MKIFLITLSVITTYLLPTEYSSDGACSCYPPSDCLMSYCVVFSSIFHKETIKLRGTSYIISTQSVGNVEVKTTVIIQDDATNITNPKGDLLSKIVIQNYSNASVGFVSQMELTIKDATNKGEPSSGEDIIKFGYSIKFKVIMSILNGGELEINLVNDHELQLNYTLNEKGDGMKYEQNEEAGYYISFPYTGSGLNGNEMNENNNNGEETTEESSPENTEFSDSSESTQDNSGDGSTGLSTAAICLLVLIIVLVGYLVMSGQKDNGGKNTELLRSPPIIDPNEDYF